MPRPRPFPPLKESLVRRLSSPGAFAAGAQLWRAGQVAHSLLALHEPLVMAAVQDGGAHQLYQVVIRHHAGEEFSAQCDCGAPAICAHGVALLLAWVNEGYTFERVAAPPASRAAQTSGQHRWRQYLQASTIPQLRAIAKRHQLRLKGTDRASILAQVVELLSAPQTLHNAAQQLSEAQRRVLQMLFMLSDGVPDTVASELQAALGWVDVNEVEDALRELREWGLVVAVPSQWRRSDPYTVAPDAMHLVMLVSVAIEKDGSTFDKPRTAFVRLFDDDVSRLRIESASCSVPEILLLARHLNLRARPAPPELAQAQTIKSLRDWPHQIDELVKLQVKPGWLHQSDSVLSAPPPPPRLDEASLAQLSDLTCDPGASDFISRLLPVASVPIASVQTAPSSVERNGNGGEIQDLRAVFETWQRLTTWTELWNAQRGNPLVVRRAVSAAHLTYGEWLAQLARGRRFVSRVLALLPAGRWHDFHSLLETIHTINADFLYERQLFPNLSPAWWLEWRSRKVDPQKFELWRVSYGSFIEHILRGPLRWLGAVETVLDVPAPPAADDAETPATSLKAFRITTVGAALLRGEPLAAPEEADRPLKLFDDLSAQLPIARNDFSAHLTLERLARFERVCDGHTCYRFDEANAHAAFEDGLTAEDVLAQLERLSGAPAPAPVRAQWFDWWAHYAQVRWYDDLTVIEFADDYTLQELLTQTDLREHLLFTFGPRLVVIRPESAEAIARQLVKKGYTPKIET